MNHANSMHVWLGVLRRGFSLVGWSQNIWTRRIRAYFEIIVEFVCCAELVPKERPWGRIVYRHK